MFRQRSGILIDLSTIALVFENNVVFHGWSRIRLGPAIATDERKNFIDIAMERIFPRVNLYTKQHDTP